MHDKKNEAGTVLFALLKNMGEPVWDIEVPNKLIQEAFIFYTA
jgi:3-dehydroquinate synthase